MYTFYHFWGTKTTYNLIGFKPKKYETPNFLWPGPKWVHKGCKGQTERFWGIVGRILTPLGLSVAPNVHILSFLGHRNHLEPDWGQPRKFEKPKKTFEAEKEKN